MRNVNLKKISSILTVLILSLLVVLLSGCTISSVSNRLKAKHYIVKVETKKPEVDKGDVIRKELFAYNPNTGDEIKGTEYVSKTDADEFYSANKQNLENAGRRIVKQGKTVYYGSKKALKDAGLIK